MNSFRSRRRQLHARVRQLRLPVQKVRAGSSTIPVPERSDSG